MSFPIEQIPTRGDTTWLDCGSVNGAQESVRQIELYRLGALLSFVRKACGEEWLPPLLHLQSADDGRLGDVPLLRNANVQFGAPGLAIGIPTELLSRSPTTAGSVADISVSNAAATTMHDGITGIEAALKEAVRSQLKNGVTGIGTVANSLGVSPRTLQRTLAEYE